MIEHLTEVPQGDCLSELQLDEYRADELSPHEGDRVAKHLASCELCRNKHNHLQGEAQAFLQAFPDVESLSSATSSSSPNSVPRNLSWMARRGGAVAALALAATLLLFVGPLFRGSQASLQVEAEVSHPDGRGKGGTSFGFHVFSDGKVRLGQDGERVHPGDQLRFFVKIAEAPRYLVVLGLDAEGVVSAYSPDPTQITTTEQFSLDSSVELDAVLGREALFAVTCVSKPNPQELGQSLKSDGKLAESLDCEVNRSSIVKAAR